MYIAFKHLHMALALVTLISFCIRSYWAFTGSILLNNKIVKVLPHIIDTIFLLSAICLMIILHQCPVIHAWLTAKLIGLLAYIMFGVLAIKKAKTNLQRFVYFSLATACFIYTGAVAITKNALFFM